MRYFYRFILLLTTVIWILSSGFSSILQKSLPITPLPTSPSPSIPSYPGFRVRIHPDAPYYTGDIFSFEISSPANTLLTIKETREIHVQAAGPFQPGGASAPAQINVGTAAFSDNSNPHQLRAVLSWVWETRNLPPGWYRLTFSTSPVVYTWSQDIELLSPDRMPDAQKGAHWASVETNCCLIFYITGTEAERDLSSIQQIADTEAEKASQQMGIDLNSIPDHKASALTIPTAAPSPEKKPVIINLIPRVIGNGGFTTDQIYISYLDRNYAGSTFRQVLHHEIIHVLDGKLGGELRPTLFVEGLAVYESGGHFKPEPLSPRAAAALDQGLYLPLKPLIDSFYSSQHEIGYLEGASLIEYMVKTYGRDGFNGFYRDIHPSKDGTQSTPIDTALQKHFHIGLADLETQFIHYLKTLPFTSDEREDILDSIAYYDTVRRYQEILDPSVYFRQVWLPNANDMRKHGIVADYLRHPQQPSNQAIESLLITVDAQLRAGQYKGVSQTLKQVNQELDRYSSISLYSWILAPQLQDYYLMFLGK